MKNPTLTQKAAMARLSLQGSRLILQHRPDGDHYYVIPASRSLPGGRLDSDDAKAILQRACFEQFDDGLFPDHPQSWRIVS